MNGRHCPECGYAMIDIPVNALARYNATEGRVVFVHASDVTPTGPAICQRCDHKFTVPEENDRAE